MKPGICSNCSRTESPKWYKAGTQCLPCYQREKRLKDPEKARAAKRASYAKNPNSAKERARKRRESPKTREVVLESKRAYHAANRETTLEQRRQRYANDPAYRTQRQAEAKTWREENPDWMPEYRQRYYEANKEELKLESSTRYLGDREAKAKKIRVWEANNKPKRDMAKIRREARMAQATTKWTSIEEFYEIYKNCPEGYVVDHIVPITSNTVSGLHTPANIQYLSLSDSSIKHNKFDDTHGNESWKERKQLYIDKGLYQEKMAKGSFSEKHFWRTHDVYYATPKCRALECMEEAYFLRSKSDDTLDHIVPLNGENVSGLHVPENFHPLDRRFNGAKGNDESEDAKQPRDWDAVYAEVRKLKSEGQSLRQIEKAVGISRPTVIKILKTK